MSEPEKTYDAESHYVVVAAAAAVGQGRLVIQIHTEAKEVLFLNRQVQWMEMHLTISLALSTSTNYIDMLTAAENGVRCAKNGGSLYSERIGDR